MEISSPAVDGVCGDYGAHRWRSNVGGLKGVVGDGAWMDDDGKHVARQISGWIDRTLEE